MTSNSMISNHLKTLIMIYLTHSLIHLVDMHILRRCNLVH